jgi:hypothetical protein
VDLGQARRPHAGAGDRDGFDKYLRADRERTRYSKVI